MCRQRAAFAALIVGEKHKAPVVYLFQQQDAAVGPAGFIHRGHAHGGGLFGGGMDGFVQPFFKLRQRLIGAIGLGKLLFAVVFTDIVQIHRFLLSQIAN